MLNCKETTHLISMGLDRKLSLRQRMNLRLHLLMCSACSAYQKQINMLNRLIRRRFADVSMGGAADEGSACPDEAKRRIIEKLNKQTK